MNMSQGNSQAAFDYFNPPFVTRSTTTNTNPDDPSPTQPEPSPPENDNTTTTNNDAASRAKRTACTLCRKRKLRCDGTRPACATCARLSHNCQYDEVRRKSGPKRGYVKVLEARLAQVESLLKTQDSVDSNGGDGMDLEAPAAADFAYLEMDTSAGRQYADALRFPYEQPREAARAVGQEDLIQQDLFGPNTFAQDPFMPETFNWDLIALGLEEPLPMPEVMDDLYAIYFDKLHINMPTIHQTRFFAAMNLAPRSRPPVAIRYAIWALAAASSDKYAQLADPFYRRARKYLEIDEMRGQGEAACTVAHCQAWILCAIFEFQNIHFPRAWLSTGKACRLAQMLGLDRLDGGGTSVKEPLPPPKDWIEKEERRRTFWGAYWCDRCSSIGTGWPMIIDERDIKTHLPTSEEAFRLGQDEKTTSLAEALECRKLDHSAYATTVMMACMFGRNLTHLHRPTPDDRPGDLNGQFWMRHRKIDSILTYVALNLPDRLRLGSAIPDSAVVYLNMSLQTSTICLHQAAIVKAESHQLPEHILAESKLRCIAAAGQIATVMRTVCHMDLSTMNPFVAFCLYVAGRVFVQYLSTKRNDQQSASSFHFLLNAMHALKKKNPLNSSFLAQLEVDMDTAGVRNPYSDQILQEAPKSAKMGDPRRGKCIAIYDISNESCASSTIDLARSTTEKRPLMGGSAPNFINKQGSNDGLSPMYACVNPTEMPTLPAQQNWNAASQSFADVGQVQDVFGPHASGDIITELSPSGIDDSSSPSLRADSFSTPHSNTTPADAACSQNSLYKSLSNPSPAPQYIDLPLHGGIYTPTGISDDFSHFNDAVFGGAVRDATGGFDYATMNWESGGMGMGTGMTPAGSGEQWAQMLDSINEWDEKEV